MNNDILCFYSNSIDRIPGHGPHEQVSDVSRYQELQMIPNWRQKLSNFAVAPFLLSGRTWRTVEHYFQAQKLRLVDPELAETFTVESGTVLGTKGSGLDARKMRKARILSRELLEKWESEKEKRMEEAWKEKFTQNLEMRKVLVATGKATLLHAAPRMPIEHWKSLESFRETL